MEDTFKVLSVRNPWICRVQGVRPREAARLALRLTKLFLVTTRRDLGPTDASSRFPLRVQLCLSSPGQVLNACQSCTTVSILFAMTVNGTIPDVPMKEEEEDDEELRDAPPTGSTVDVKSAAEKPAGNTNMELDNLFDDDDDDEFPSSSAVDSKLPSSPPIAIPP